MAFPSTVKVYLATISLAELQHGQNLNGFDHIFVAKYISTGKTAYAVLAIYPASQLFFKA